MQNEKTRTYEATIRGRETGATIPENSKPEDLLADAIRENLTPDAVAAIAAWLQSATTRDASVNRQIAWFREQLVVTIGGYDALNQAMEDLGL